MGGKKICILILVSGIVLFSSACRTKESNPAEPHGFLPGIVYPDHHYIQYVGRFDRNDPLKAVFDWPGVIIRARFEGTRCLIRLNDGKNLYDVTLFCICGPMIGEPCAAYIKEVVNQCQQNNENKKVHYMGISTSLLTMADRGSDWHPNIQGQQKIADTILPVIRRQSIKPFRNQTMRIASPSPFNEDDAMRSLFIPNPNGTSTEDDPDASAINRADTENPDRKSSPKPHAA